VDVIDDGRGYSAVPVAVGAGAAAASSANEISVGGVASGIQAAQTGEMMGQGKGWGLRLVNGLVRPSSGRVLVDGVDVSRHGGAVRRRVGFCFTDPSAQLVMPTVVEDVELSLRHRIRERGPRRAAALARPGDPVRSG
jgi:ABC-type sulfate/molybdate transport systems ATPase subunit